VGGTNGIVHVYASIAVEASFMPDIQPTKDLFDPAPSDSNALLIGVLWIGGMMSLVLLGSHWHSLRPLPSLLLAAPGALSVFLSFSSLLKTIRAQFIIVLAVLVAYMGLVATGDFTGISPGSMLHGCSLA
jgi:hypothetical protein